MRVCFWIFSLLIVAAAAKTPAKKRILVILENEELKTTHALFFDDLKAKGFTVTFRFEKDKGVALEKWGEYQYDNLILFTPTARHFGRRLSIKEVIDFVDSGRNLMLIGSPELSKRVFDVGAECGIDFETSGSNVLDHFHHAKLEGKDFDPHLITVEPENRIRELFDKRKSGRAQHPLLYRGIGHSVAADQEYVTVAVAGNPTSYSWDPDQPTPEVEKMLAGRDLSLISMMQTRHNARVTVVGSLDFFSNELFTTPFTSSKHPSSTERMVSGNREFAQDLALWTFQSIGVLRTRTPRHYNRMTGVKPPMYTTKDPIHFEVDIMEYVEDHWQPYHAKDVQLEYYMMSPYIRLPLEDQGNGTFALDLVAPDVHGVFKFLVTYHRPGYSNVDITEMAPIRPFRHDEYERFILTAYPYYASVFSMMVGFWVFGMMYLYHK